MKKYLAVILLMLPSCMWDTFTAGLWKCHKDFECKEISQFYHYDDCLQVTLPPSPGVYYECYSKVISDKHQTVPNSVPKENDK